MGWWKAVVLGVLIGTVAGAVSWWLQGRAGPTAGRGAPLAEPAAPAGAELDFGVSVDEPGVLKVDVRNRGGAPALVRGVEHCPPGTLHLYRARGPNAGEFLPDEAAPLLMRITSREADHDVGAYCAPAERVVFPLKPPRRIEPGAELSVRFRFSPAWSVASDREYELPADAAFCSFALDAEPARRLELMRCGSEPVARVEPETAPELPDTP